jgi:hypothetical protein
MECNNPTPNIKKLPPPSPYQPQPSSKKPQQATPKPPAAIFKLPTAPPEFRIAI